ncbi:MAG: NUDIX domain-containing protein [Alphaproteobacteria bacterium]|nr:NUDIX domain-containing protein [Alphaproteobacteria bacterium]
MIKDKSFSAYIIPVRVKDGETQVAMLNYGSNNYGPIGGRLDDGEDLKNALQRELTEELGQQSVKMLDMITEIPVAYSFKHSSPERAEKRGAWSEEHHYFITKATENIDLEFCEKRNEKISVVWINAADLTNSDIIHIEDMREFFAEHILPNIDCKFSMSVQHKYFELIKSGQKDIELRAYDEKRKRITIGDKFLLFDAEKTPEYIICEVLNMHIASDFESLFEKIDIKRAGFKTVQELIDIITKFIPYEKLTQEQVVGIEIKRIR